MKKLNKFYFFIIKIFLALCFLPFFSYAFDKEDIIPISTDLKIYQETWSNWKFKIAGFGPINLLSNEDKLPILKQAIAINDSVKNSFALKLGMSQPITPSWSAGIDFSLCLVGPLGTSTHYNFTLTKSYAFFRNFGTLIGTFQISPGLSNLYMNLNSQTPYKSFGLNLTLLPGLDYYLNDWIALNLETGIKGYYMFYNRDATKSLDESYFASQTEISFGLKTIF